MVFFSENRLEFRLQAVGSDHRAENRLEFRLQAVGSDHRA
jgi:hypothetical protein